jgi:hypothetical protein
MDKPPQEMTPTGETTALTEPSPTVLDTWENWISFDGEGPPSIEWLMEQEARDKRVGALLRELHYSVTSEKPHLLHHSENEDSYWSGVAGNLPGLNEVGLLTNVMSRRSSKTI